jgi:hypothetical protein
MRTHDNGSGFTVGFNESDTEDFSDSWPCSAVRGKGYFSFDNNGDLVDIVAEYEGETINADGDDWVAFAKECQAYGEAHIGKLRKRHEKQKLGIG